MQLKDPGQSIPLYEQMMQRYHNKEITDSRSPVGNWLGATLLDAAHGMVRLSVVIKHEMTNPYGNIHGGMMSAFIDETIGWAVVSLDADYHYTSLNLNVDFLYAAKEGETMTAMAQVLREGKKIVHVECAVHNSDGVLLAKASSNLINTSMQLKS
ncbi:MAG: PaaI family thioesterase [Bacteroidetes bacterium]|nr:PaaI family thioesterase [Bacteroidota bacterium]